jgi:uncharacterized OB-fold protein
MTERAKRAADELRRRGWQMDADNERKLERSCVQCGYQMPPDARYCQNCGTRVEIGVGDGALEDIEAALVAAEQEPK